MNMGKDQDLLFLLCTMQKDLMQCGELITIKNQVVLRCHLWLALPAPSGSPRSDLHQSFSWTD